MNMRKILWMITTLLVFAGFSYAEDDSISIFGANNNKLGGMLFNKKKGSLSHQLSVEHEIEYNPGATTIINGRNNDYFVYSLDYSKPNMPVRKVHVLANEDGLIYEAPKTYSNWRPSNQFVLGSFNDDLGQYVFYAKNNSIVVQQINEKTGDPLGKGITIFTSKTGQIVSASVVVATLALPIVVTYDPALGYFLNIGTNSYRLGGSIIHVDSSITPDGILLTYTELRNTKTGYEVANFTAPLVFADGQISRFGKPKQISPWNAISSTASYDFRFGSFGLMDITGDGYTDGVLYSFNAASCNGRSIQYFRFLNQKTGSPIGPSKQVTQCESSSFNRGFEQLEIH